MKLLGTARLALNRIWATKVRSLLTMLGVVIGVAAIVALTSIVDGASQGINKSLATLGTNQLNITAMAPDALTEQDAYALAELDGVSVMFVQTQNQGTIATDEGRVNANLVGVSAKYFEAVKPELAMGSYLSDSQFAASAKDVVFGADAANDLGLTDSMLGQTVKLNGQDFRLVGVLDDQAGFGTNGRVYVTLDSARKLFSQYPYVSSIVVQAETPEAVDALQIATDKLLRERYGLGSETDARYTITNQASLIAAVSSITDTLGLLLTGIAGISLVVGGIGIMNIMLVSVRERTREIGVRRAIGAKQSNILTQFLIEAIVLSLAGGVVGHEHLQRGAGQRQVVGVVARGRVGGAEAQAGELAVEHHRGLGRRLRGLR